MTGIVAHTYPEWWLKLTGQVAHWSTDYSSHSGCYEDAREVADLVEAQFPNLDGNVEIYYVGTTIGSHTGPGTVALFFWGNERVD